MSKLVLVKDFELAKVNFKGKRGGELFLAEEIESGLNVHKLSKVG